MVSKKMLDFINLGVREKIIIHCSEAEFVADKNCEFF